MRRHNDLEEKLKLSIIIITCNRKRELLKAIQSVEEEVLKMDAEIIIIDNASTDGTRELVEKYLELNTVPYKYFYSNENLGVAGGRNLSVTLSDGDYMFFLDDDAEVVSKDFFKTLLKYMRMNPDVIAASVNIQEPLNNTNLNTEFSYTDKNNLLLIASYCGCAHILRKNFWNDKPLYPDKLIFGSEEMYASNVIWAQGKLVARFDDLVVNHFPSPINRYSGKERDINFLVNQYIIKCLTYPIITLGIVRVFFVLHLLKNGLLRKKYRLQIRRYIAERFNKAYVSRMPLTCWLKMLYFFGWKTIL